MTNEGRRSKGLKKARRFSDHFLKSAHYLKDWNNSAFKHVKIFKAVAIYTVNLYNVTFNDLSIKEFTKYGTRTDKIYVIIIIGLSVHGKMSRGKTMELLNLSYKSANAIINQYVEHGYLKEVITQRSNLIKGVKVMLPCEEIELTSKGYDLLNHIFSILIDDSFL